MSASKEVAVPDQPGEIAELSQQEAALVAAQNAEFDGIQLVVPLLKVGQPLTREVQDGEAEAGDYINALTGDDLGSEIEFIVSGFHRGRFKSVDGGNTYVAAGSTVPESWTEDEDVVFAGQPFSEHPDAEEQYRERVNRKEIEWGSGPPIQTTYNFTGYVIGHDVPVRLSLKSTHVKPARRWITLMRILRTPWDIVFELGTDQQENQKRQKYYVPTIKRGRNTTSDERERAVELAQQLRDADTVKVAGSDEVAPEAAAQAAEAAETAAQEAGGLGVK